MQHASSLFISRSLLARALFGPSNLFAAGYDESWNRREIRAAEMPSSNGIANARSLAREYAAMIGEVDGTRILSSETVEAARGVQSAGCDNILSFETAFGIGFALPPMLCPSVGTGAFGHPGAGGSLAFADPEAGIGFGYVMNRMKLGATSEARLSSRPPTHVSRHISGHVTSHGRGDWAVLRPLMSRSRRQDDSAQMVALHTAGSRSP